MTSEMRPDVVVVDPLSALRAGGTLGQSNIMVLRLIDYLKSAGTTALYLNVQSSDDMSEMNISSLMDTWIKITNPRDDNVPERRVFVVKSRGMSHSATMSQFEIGTNGVRISDRKGRS
jgi:circadian clock protein KaiC